MEIEFDKIWYDLVVSAMIRKTNDRRYFNINGHEQYLPSNICVNQTDSQSLFISECDVNVNKTGDDGICNWWHKKCYKRHDFVLYLKLTRILVEKVRWFEGLGGCCSKTLRMT